MIIGSDGPLKIGERYEGIINRAKGEFHPEQPYFVIREATADEFSVYNEEEGSVLTPSLKSWLEKRVKAGAKFYLISLD